jgi:GH24 family phage-related lysozyme (muramidase)
MFYKGSRYENVKTTSYTDENNQEQIHKKIRFIKETPPEFEYKIKQNERLDLVTHKFYSDPTKFWVICDGNNVMHPEELEVPIKEEQLGSEEEAEKEKFIIIPEDTF